MAYEVSFKTTPTLAKMISNQINMELFSAYHYHATGFWLKSQELHGMAEWMFVQAEEEMTHSRKLTNFALDRDIPFTFDSLPAPKTEFSSILEAFETCFFQEKEVSKSFHNMYKQASADEDFPAKKLFDWYIEEQVEEEALFKGILHRLNLAKDNSAGLLILDKEFGKREGEGEEAEEIAE